MYNEPVYDVYILPLKSEMSLKYLNMQFFRLSEHIFSGIKMSVFAVQKIITV